MDQGEPGEGPLLTGLVPDTLAGEGQGQEAPDAEQDHGAHEHEQAAVQTPHRHAKCSRDPSTDHILNGAGYRRATAVLRKTPGPAAEPSAPRPARKAKGRGEDRAPNLMPET